MVHKHKNEVKKRVWIVKGAALAASAAPILLLPTFLILFSIFFLPAAHATVVGQSNTVALTRGLPRSSVSGGYYWGLVGYSTFDGKGMRQ